MTSDSSYLSGWRLGWSCAALTGRVRRWCLKMTSSSSSSRSVMWGMVVERSSRTRGTPHVTVDSFVQAQVSPWNSWTDRWLAGDQNLENPSSGAGEWTNGAQGLGMDQDRLLVCPGA